MWELGCSVWLEQKSPEVGNRFCYLTEIPTSELAGSGKESSVELPKKQVMKIAQRVPTTH